MAFAHAVQRPSSGTLVGVAGYAMPGLSVAARLRLGFILLVLLVAATWQLAAASVYPTEGNGAISVSGTDTFVMAGMMPGDGIAPVVITLRADGPVRYRVHLAWTGSPALASQALVTLDLAGPQPGSYRGALADARLGGTDWGSPFDLRLEAGQSATLTIAGTLPLSAGNEVQGATLRARVIVDSNSPLD
jgi:hypothetical protein